MLGVKMVMEKLIKVLQTINEGEDRKSWIKLLK